MKKILITTLIISLLSFCAFLGFEPSPMFAATSADSFTTSLNVTSEISITDCANIALSAISLATDASIGSTTCSIDTTNITGYTMSVAASTSPALKSGSNYFSDKSTSTMPSLWSDPGSNNQFGFSLYGPNVTSGTWGTPGTDYCGSTTPTAINSNLKWYGFMTQGTTTINTSTSTVSAIPFIFCVAAEQGATSNALSGAYYSTSTLTVSTN